MSPENLSLHLATFSQSWSKHLFGSSEPPRVLVVEDNPFSRLVAVDLLTKNGYEVIEADGSTDVIIEVLKTSPDLILLDVKMPHRNGFETCKLLKQSQLTNHIPIIVMTVANDIEHRLKSKEVNADSFLGKPLESMILLPEVELLIQRKRLSEWLDQIQQVIFLIAQAVEQRNTDGKRSGIRLDRLAQSFGEYLCLSPIEINDLVLAVPLHDIGTIVIPDAILLKKESLTDEERTLIQKHVLIGEKICQPMQNRRGIGQIIRHHHERWDGSGYPDGLSGDAIPWLAQIFQLLDIFDALTSHRSYKEALNIEQALAILHEESAIGWRNPQLVRQFINFIESQSDYILAINADLDEGEQTDR